MVGPLNFAPKLLPPDHLLDPTVALSFQKKKHSLQKCVHTWLKPSKHLQVGSSSPKFGQKMLGVAQASLGLAHIP